MKTTASYPLKPFLLLTVIASLAACADESPVDPVADRALQAQHASAAQTEGAIFATLRRVTDRYHKLDVALADSFVLLHPCEVRGDEGPVGAVYAHFGRVLDGVIKPELPDALIYETAKNGKAKLVGVEFALPYAMSPEAPTFMGQTFQPEDEFGVWALHVWVWRRNPEGMFAESNPRVACDVS